MRCGGIGEGAEGGGGNAVACHELLGEILRDSSCAAACVGPKIRRPAARKASTTPAASGASGPTTVSVMYSSLARTNSTSAGNLRARH
jgi:hypothetical protein